MIDRTNQVVAGVRPHTLAQALGLLGQGPIASFFGRLRPGVIAVDIDMVGSAGPVMAFVGWCVERGLWHVVRHSGRRGHAHVFIVAGGHLGDLERFAAQVRAAEGVSRPRIDVRTAVRPLCAPHRSEVTPPLPALARLARRLPAALAALPPGGPDRIRARGRSSPGPDGVDSGSRPAAAPPPPRRGARLPESWRQYLRTGELPLQVGQWADQSRSAVESCATFHMAAAGWSVDQAWVAITCAHPTAMGKARSRGQRWWTANVWNPAAAALGTPVEHPTTGPATSPRGLVGGEPATQQAQGDLAARVAVLVTTFRDHWQEYGRDRRHTLRFVLETLTDRMLRARTDIVPCPERDLVLDTGIRSRRVLRAALRQLHDDGWLVLQPSFRPAGGGAEARSHHVQLPGNLPHPPPLGVSAPPSSYTPLPPAARTHLGPRLWHTWAALRPQPVDPARLAGACGVGPERASTHQLRTLRARLQQLAAIGLAEVDAAGHWRRLPLSAADRSWLAEAEAARAALATEIAAERAGYELFRSGAVTWARQREAAIARSRAGAYLASRRWWTQLPEPEREQRQRHYRDQFGQLGVSGKSQLKSQLARRRQAAGVVSEEAVRVAWVASLAAAEYQARVIERTTSYWALPGPLRAALAASWSQHRNNWGVGRDHPPGPRATAIPMSVRGRDQSLAQLELLALSDVLDRDPGGVLAGIELQPAAHYPTASLAH